MWEKEILLNAFQNIWKQVIEDKIEEWEWVTWAIWKATIHILHNWDNETRSNIAKILKIKNPNERFPIDKNVIGSKFSSILETKNKVLDILVGLEYTKSEAQALILKTKKSWATTWGSNMKQITLVLKK